MSSNSIHSPTGSLGRFHASAMRGRVSPMSKYRAYFSGQSLTDVILAFGDMLSRRGLRETKVRRAVSSLKLELWSFIFDQRQGSGRGVR
jgi:hypothetical protein